MKHLHQKPTRHSSLTAITVSLCLLWLVSPASNAQSADTAAGERPRIGLVLGGGGARGAAHIGVLKVLEEERIPVDMVVGTSMGAIAAGLYASGMSAAEIEQEVLSMDWGDLFNDYPSREDLSFRRKRDDFRYTFDAQIGYNENGLQIPLAFIRGQKFDLKLNRLTMPVYEIEDFDELPIPYRAVAADLETGRDVVLGEGSLAQAIRASMAVPAAFDPVEIDGRLLVDGGIANNVPVNVARDLGADILIVVDVGSGLYTYQEINDALDVSEQLANFLFSLNTEEQLDSLGDQDVLIKPPLGDFSGGDFANADKAVPLGVAGAQQVLAELRRYSLDPEAYAAHRSSQERQPSAPPVIDFIRIVNHSNLDDEIIRRRITVEIGKPLDVEHLERDIGHVYGLEVFQSVRYDLVQEENRTGLVITAREKPWGPGYFEFGLSSSNDLQGGAIVNLGINYTRTQLNELNGEWRSGLQLGEEPAIFTELHQPLDPLSRYFVSGQLGLATQNINQFDDNGDNLGRYFLTLGGLELGAGREFGTWGEGRLGYRRQTGVAELKVGQDLADNIDADIGEFFLRLSDDRLDNLYFPRKGHYGRLEYVRARENFGASADYDQLIGSYLHAFSRGPNTFLGGVSFALTENDDAPIEGLFTIGGLFRLSGLQQDQLAGQSQALAIVGYMRRLTKEGLFSLFRSYAGVTLETGNAWQSRDSISWDSTITAGSVFLGFDTPVGPLYVAYGRTDTKEQAFYVYLGPRFVFD